MSMRSSPRALTALLPLLVLTAGTALAQPPPVAPPAAPPVAPPAAPPRSPLAPPPAGSGTAAPGATTPPLLPQVDVTDPLLIPATAAPHTLATWRDALTMISARSIDLLLTQQQVLRAQGSYQQVLSRTLPQINGAVSINQNLIPGSGQVVNGFLVPGTDGFQSPVVTTQISATQPIFALQAWYAVRTADLNIKAAKLSVDDRRRLVLAQVADAIVAVFTAERIAEINRVSLRNALQRQNLAERRARLGDGTRLDVLRAQQDAAVTRSTLIAGDESLRKARETLGLSIGETEGYGVPPNISLDDMAQSINSTCTPGTIEQRADILAAKTTLEAATRDVKGARLAYLPTAQVSSTLQLSSQQFGNNNFGWSIQGVLSIPIWDGNFRAGTVRLARASEEEAKIRLEGARRTAVLQVVQAVRAVTVAEQARVVSEQNRDLAREAARLAERAFAAGAGTSFDLIDASRQERQAELDLAVKEFNLIQSVFRRIGAAVAHLAPAHLFEGRNRLASVSSRQSAAPGRRQHDDSPFQFRQ
jgi:outer membrane protein TolC